MFVLFHIVSIRNTYYFEKTRYQGSLPISYFDSVAILAPADLLGFLLHGMPLKYALAATAASQQYLYQAPLAVRMDRNDSKSGLASPNFFFQFWHFFSSCLFSWNFFRENSQETGNNFCNFPQFRQNSVNISAKNEIFS